MDSGQIIELLRSLPADGEVAIAVEEALGYVERHIPKNVVKDGDWSPMLCPTCGCELSYHLGDGVYDHYDWLEYCPND